MSVVYVSPRHVSSDLAGASIEKKLEVFEAQVKGWLLDHAEALSSSQYSASQHAGKSKTFFKDGLVAIFPENTPDLNKYSDDFYREVRCGLIHQGMTRGKIGISRDAPSPIQINQDPAGAFQFAMINPWLFLARVKQHFDCYLVDVRNPANTILRSSFETWFE